MAAARLAEVLVGVEAAGAMFRLGAELGVVIGVAGWLAN